MKVEGLPPRLSSYLTPGPEFTCKEHERRERLPCSTRQLAAWQEDVQPNNNTMFMFACQVVLYMHNI
jgi:hypothetical protein